MLKQFSILTLSLLVLACCQGCLAFRYTITPPVSGKVIDRITKMPIEGATVGFKNHENRLSTSSADGSFTSRPDHIWRPCFLLPGELWPSGGQFFIEAKGYKNHQQEIVTRMGRPFTIVEPIELDRDKQK